MLGTAQVIPTNYEWENFVQRSGSMLIDPNAPDRTIDSIRFPNEGHASTKPLIEGTLERKSRNKLSFAGYTTGYYVVTPSRFLHEFKDNDNMRKDPTPELSIYLPEAVIGATNGEKFHVKGKDVSKGIGSKLSGSSEINFKAHSASDALKWFEVISSVAGAAPVVTAGSSEPTSPISPVEKRNTLPAYSDEKPTPIQTAGITGGETVASPTATVASPTAASGTAGAGTAPYPTTPVTKTFSKE